MKTKYKIFYTLSVITSLLFSACQTKSNIDIIEEIDDKIIVQCILNPMLDTTTMSINIAKGVSKKGKKLHINDLESAKITISHDGTNIPLRYLKTETNTVYFYILNSELIIEENKEYQLDIVNNDIINVSAKTTTPDYDFSFSLKDEGKDTIEGMVYYLYYLDITNPSTDKHYYYRYNTYATWGKDSTNGYNIINDQYFINDGSTQENKKKNIQLNEYEWENGYPYIINVIMNEDYYLYYKSYQDLINNFENPFSEPRSLRSNIEGGMGVFGAAYSKRMNMF